LRAPTVGIIAEVKRASPSRGPINADLNAADQARAYQRGGAVAISVLTEPTRFGGSNEDLIAVRAAVDLPVVKKDFHVAVIQLIEARALGASAALVIARAVPQDRLVEMVGAARDIGLEILIEVRDSFELDLALSLDAELIGVNNRDLETLAVDSSTADRFIPLVPLRSRAIVESGIATRADVERAAAKGADAVLVGAAVSESPDPEAAVRSLVGVPRSVDARQN
jgi:indole-3-glycerol phosphate synthase